MQSMNLPGSLQALEKPLGLPPSLTSHAEEIRQQDGLHHLRRSMHETSKLKENDVGIFQEGVELLRYEATEDDRAKLKHGTDRWSRFPSQQAAQNLYTQVIEIEGYLKSAAGSDELVKSKLKECESAIQVLSGSNRDLEEYVPSSRRTTLSFAVERASSDLRQQLNSVSQLESRRRKQATQLREKAKNDDINTVILAETARLERDSPMQKIEPAQFESLFSERLALYAPDKDALANETTLQATLTSSLTAANTAFTTARRGDTSTLFRERALQRLEAAYLKCKEILTNIATGRKFYNDLAKIVSRFRDDCQHFAHARRVEARQMETELSNAMSAMSLRQRDSLKDQKQREGLRESYSAKPHEGEVLTAPVPTRPEGAAPGMWRPEVGIKFAAAPPLQQGGGVVHHPAYPSTRGRGGEWDVSRGVRFG